VRTFAAISAASLDIYMDYSRGPTVLYDTAVVWLMSYCRFIRWATAPRC